MASFSDCDVLKNEIDVLKKELENERNKNIALSSALSIEKSTSTNYLRIIIDLRKNYGKAHQNMEVEEEALVNKVSHANSFLNISI